MKSINRYRCLAILLLGFFISVTAYGGVNPLGKQSGALKVYPSGDSSGTTDYQNIQNAMDLIEPGGEVVLAPGHFYINAGIVVEGFNGSLKGTSQGKKVLTTIEAVTPFSFTHESNYFMEDRVQSSMLFFEFPEESVTVKDLIFQALESTYTDPPHPVYNSALRQFIAEWGNDVDVTYSNLEFIAGDGDYYGSNVVVGIHSMRGPACEVIPCNRIMDSSLHGTGNAVFREIQSSRIADHTIAPMWYRDGTMRISSINSDASITPWGLINMETDIKNVNAVDGWRALWFFFVTGGTTNVEGVYSDSGPWPCPSIVMYAAENISFRNSQVTNCNGLDAFWRTPVLVAELNQNLEFVNNSFSNIIGTTAAIGVLPYDNDSIVIRDNYYDPWYFTGPPGAWAIFMGGDNSLVIEPGLTSHQVIDVGTNNIFKLGE